MEGADEIERRISVARSGGRHETFRKYLAMKKLKKAALSEIANHYCRNNIFPLTHSTCRSHIASGNFSPALKDALIDLREELKLSGEDTMDWKDFLTGTMDKNLAMREDKIRQAFDHFRHADDNCLVLSDLVEIFGGEALDEDEDDSMDMTA